MLGPARRSHALVIDGPPPAKEERAGRAVWQESMKMTETSMAWGATAGLGATDLRCCVGLCPQVHDAEINLGIMPASQSFAGFAIDREV